MTNKVLFILKRREDFNAKVHTKEGLTTGLYNSANFMSDMLNEVGVEAKTVVVTDNNDIDREVSLYKPTHCIIEAIWVIPSKFQILQKLHPNVKWIIRIHSETPFMANEGMAFGWFGDYIKYKNVVLAPNAPRMYRELREFFLSINPDWLSNIHNKVIYLPNYYPHDFKVTKNIDFDKDHINIGCFGAIRPLKNHILQALAAVEYCESIQKKLHFHINAGRIEMKGEPVLNNLKGIFEHLYDRGHKLITHQWVVREEFLKICGEMDIGLQVSFSETFNIVAADLVSQGVPVVTSVEIPWAASYYNANPVDSLNIRIAIHRAYSTPKFNVFLNRLYLKQYTNKTKSIWKQYFKED